VNIPLYFVQFSDSLFQLLKQPLEKPWRQARYYECNQMVMLMEKFMIIGTTIA